MEMYSHYSGGFSQQSTTRCTCIQSVPWQQAAVVMAAAVPPETMRGERGKQRENTDEDELDLYDVLVRRGWGHVASYE